MSDEKITLKAKIQIRRLPLSYCLHVIVVPFIVERSEKNRAALARLSYQLIKDLRKLGWEIAIKGILDEKEAIPVPIFGRDGF